MGTSNRQRPVPKNPYRFAFNEDEAADIRELSPPDQMNRNTHLLNQIFRMLTLAFGRNNDNMAAVRARRAALRRMPPRDPIEIQYDDQYPRRTPRQTFQREGLISLATVEEANAPDDEEEEGDDTPESGEQNRASTKDRAASL